MEDCCPPGEGCNSPSALEACSLSRLRRSASPDAERALNLWRRYVQSRGAARQRRVLRRAYGRTRDRALGVWSPWATLN